MSLNAIPSKNFCPENNHVEMINIAIKNFKKLQYDKDEIDIIPENLPCRPWYLGGEWHQYGFGPSLDMIQFCKATNLKITYDICHAQLWCSFVTSCKTRKGTSLLDYTKEIMPYVSHMHISDARGLNGEGIQMFEGEIDFESIFNASAEYDFSWVTEIWSGHLHNGAGTHKAMRDLETHYSSKL